MQHPSTPYKLNSTSFLDIGDRQLCHFPNIMLSSAAPHYICLFDFSPNLYKLIKALWVIPFLAQQMPLYFWVVSLFKGNVVKPWFGLTLMTCRYHDLVGSAKLQDEKCDLIRHMDTPISTYLMGRPLQFPPFQYLHRPSTCGRFKFKKNSITLKLFKLKHRKYLEISRTMQGHKTEEWHLRAG